MQIKLKKSAFIAFIAVFVFAVIGGEGALAAPPTIGAISDQTVFEDQPTLPLLMSLSDAETPLLNLQLSGASSDETLVPPGNIFFGLAGGNWYMTVTPAFGRTGSATVTVTVNDGTESASTNFLLTVNPPPPGAGRFVNPSSFAIPDSGAATSYPATNLVTGMIGTITNMVVTLSRFSHNRVQEVSMLLVSPTGLGVVIFSHICGSDRSATNVTVCLADSSPYWLPLDFALWSEPLKPTVYGTAVSFPAPAPAGPYGPVALSTFNGLTANGTWTLYVYDEQATNSGVIAGGWSLMIATSGGSSVPAISDISDQFTAVNTPTAAIPFTIGDADTPVGSLTLGRNSSNTTLVPTNNIVFGGSGSNRTVTVIPATGQTGSAVITVTVSDGANTANDGFVLTVGAANTPPTISTIANQTVNEDTSTGPVSFTIGDGETAAGSLTLSKGSSNPALVPTNNIVFGGNGGNRTVTVAPATNQNGTATITVTVSDGLLSTNTSFLVTVNAVNDAPTISDIPNQSTAVGTATGVIPFTVGDVETVAGSLTLFKGSSNPLLVPTNNIVFGGSGSNRTVTVTPAAGQTGTATITVSVSDGTSSNGDNFVITVGSLFSGTMSFTNAAAITIPTTGAATPYPSTINVSGMAGAITNVTVMLYGLSHDWSRDPGAVLVGPAGQTVVLFTGIGEGGALNNLTLTFSDAAGVFIPNNATVTNGTYKGADYEWSNTNGFVDPFFPSPAPARPVGAPYTNQLAAFNGLTANGTWSLYVADGSSVALSQGQITGGWSMTITTAGGSSSPTISDIADQSIAINTNTGPIPFTIGDADTAVSNLVMSASSSNTNLVPANSIVFGGGGSNRTVTVTPATGQTGTATITVSVSDGTNSASDNFVLTVSVANTRPTISAITNQTINEDTFTGPISFTVGDAETAAGSLTLGRSSSNLTLVPTNNIVFGGSGSNRTVTVTPASNQNGTATITVTVSDGLLSTNTSFLLTVNAVNDPPVANNQPVATLEDTPTNIVLTASDIDSTTLSFAVLAGPTNGVLGTLNTNTGGVSYTPNANYNGPDSFRFRASDGSLLSTGTVSITVIPVDDPPAAANQNVATLEDTMTNIVLTVSDIDSTDLVSLSETLALTGVSSPDSWTLGAGVDKVSAVAINDGDTSYINSSATNNTQQQFAVADSIHIKPGDPITSVTLRAACSRVTKNCSYVLTTILGTKTSNSISHMAGNGYTQVSDTFPSKPGGGAWTLTDIQNLEVRIQNTAAFEMKCTQFDVIVNYLVPAYTTNLSFAIRVGPTNGILGTLNTNSGMMSYTPYTNYNGPDSFRFTARSGSLLSTGSVNITVLAVNDAPLVQNDNYSMGVGSTLVVGSPGVLANDSDVDGDSLSAVLASIPAHGILGLSANGGFSYTPTNYYIGTDSFTYRASDGLTNSGLAMTTITVSDELRILSIAVTNGMVRMTWTSISNKVYRLQYKNSLTDTNWNDATPDVLASGPITSVTNAVGSSQQRFYRVR